MSSVRRKPESQGGATSERHGDDLTFSVALNVSWGLRTLGWLDIMLGGAFLALLKHRAQISPLLLCALRNIFSSPRAEISPLMTSGLADLASDGDLYLASEVQSNVANAREPCSH